MNNYITLTYIGGGSKDWAHKNYADILTQDKLNGEIRLYDIDTAAAQRNKLYFEKLKKDNPEKVKSEWKCVVINNIDTALTGADFVVISILPYSLKNMKVDVHHPEKYGIWQSVGDTVGPGGYSRALRTIPAYRFFASKIRENCPDSWVISYTNPMAMCVNTLYKEFPEIKAFGCCHEVFGVQWMLAAITGMYEKLTESGKAAFMNGDLKRVKQELKALGKKFSIWACEGIDRHEIKINVQGINHFTWLNCATYNGTDLMPIYSAFISLFRENNKNRLGQLVPALVKRRRNCESVKFEMFEKFGKIAAAGDRHLAEFMPNVYLTTKHVLKDGFILTPVWGRIGNDKFLRIRTRIYLSPLVKAKFKNSGEEGVAQITALCGLGDLVTNVNLLNRGQAPSIITDTAVETNAQFSENSLVPDNSGEMSPETAELVNIHAKNQKDFIDVYFEKDKEKLREVFCRDPAVMRIGKDNGRRLFEEMIAANASCLEGFLKSGGVYDRYC